MLIMNCCAPPAPRSIPWVRCSAATGSSSRSRKLCGWSALRTSTSRHRAVKLAGDPGRRDTVLHTALQVVSDANTLLTPFLPHASQKVHEALGGNGVWAAEPRSAR